MIFDKKITLGNIIQIVMLLVACVAAYYGLIGSINKVEAKNTQSITKVDSRVNVHEVQIRSVQAKVVEVETRIESRLNRMDNKLDRLLAK